MFGLNKQLAIELDKMGKYIDYMEASLKERENRVVIGKTRLMDAVLSNHIVGWPDDWTPDDVLERLSRDDNYSHDELVVHQYFEDWNTKALAKHMEDIIRAIDPSYIR